MKLAVTVAALGLLAGPMAANAVPFFVGVFDTVASLGSYALSAALVGGAAGLIAALSYLQSFFLFPFLPTFL